jgi:hypothetical protein
VVEELSSESDTSSVIRLKVEDRGFCFNGLGALQYKRVAEQNRGLEDRGLQNRTEQRNRGQRVAEQNRGIEDRGLQHRTGQRVAAQNRGL